MTKKREVPNIFREMWSVNIDKQFCIIIRLELGKLLNIQSAYIF